MRKKRYITLLEIMIVILLIGIITSVVGYNVKGSLEKGKIFKSRQAQKQIKDLLLLEVASGTNIDEVVSNPEKYLAESGLPKDPKDLINDGWGDRFQIKATRDKTDIEVTSKKMQKYDKDHKTITTKTDEEDYY